MKRDLICLTCGQEYVTVKFIDYSGKVYYETMKDCHCPSGQFKIAVPKFDTVEQADSWLTEMAGAL